LEMIGGQYSMVSSKPQYFGGVAATGFISGQWSLELVTEQEFALGCSRCTAGFTVALPFQEGRPRCGRWEP
jgi:hypothetical protein